MLLGMANHQKYAHGADELRLHYQNVQIAERNWEIGILKITAVQYVE